MHDKENSAARFAAYVLGDRGHASKASHPKKFESFRSDDIGEVNNGVAQLRRGRRAAALGEHDEAVEAFNEAVRLSPHSPTALVLRAESYRSLHDYSKARKDVREALRLDPQNQTAMKLAAQILVSSPEAKSDSFTPSTRRERKPLRELQASPMANRQRTPTDKRKNSKIPASVARTVTGRGAGKLSSSWTSATDSDSSSSTSNSGLSTSLYGGSGDPARAAAISTLHDRAARPPIILEKRYRHKKRGKENAGEARITSRSARDERVPKASARKAALHASSRGVRARSPARAAATSKRQSRTSPRPKDWDLRRHTLKQGDANKKRSPSPREHVRSAPLAARKVSHKSSRKSSVRVATAPSPARSRSQRH